MKQHNKLFVVLFISKFHTDQQNTLRVTSTLDFTCDHGPKIFTVSSWKPQRVVGENILENLTGVGMLFMPPHPQLKGSESRVVEILFWGVEVQGLSKV